MMRMFGGGGGLPPGVAGDGGSPGGLVVAGQFEVDGGSGLVELLTRDGGGLSIAKHSDQNYALELVLSAGSSGGEVRMVDNLGPIFSIDADGTIHTVGAVCFWNHAPPGAQPVLATGAGHSVDDVITLLQSYGVCKQA